MNIPLRYINVITIIVSTFVNAQITYESAFPNIDFQFPIEIQSPKDGSERMFVVEQAGRIKVFPRTPNILSGDVATFLDITDRVRFSNGQEIGLLGLAFHPDFTNNKYIYVYYTANSDLPGVNIKMVLSRFTVQTGNSNLADPNSELIIFQFDKNQTDSNHNGGKIAFGPDGYLYISFGDGGGGNDPRGNSQNINNVFGSICRIDVDINGDNPLETNPDLPNGNYEIPSDNPFVGINGLDEIYAYGIRNTWKFSFDEVTGTLWGADVGQGVFEEINRIEKGKNYGWKRFEANVVANDVTINGSTEFPVFFYNHSQGDVSITGGYIYRGSEITSLNPDISSKYIYGDYISGRVWALDYNVTTGMGSSTLLFKTNGEYISSFGVDTHGELYFSDYGNNAKIYKLVDGTTTTVGTAVNGIGTWQNLGAGIINGLVQAIAADANGDVYVAGTFSNAGNIIANNMAVWNKTSGWRALGSGSDGSINDLKIDANGHLFAGGSFSQIGGISAQNIAMWNGSVWSALGSGINGNVAALEIDESGNLFVGGVFESVNGMSARNIAKWNGSSWAVLNDATTSISGTNNEIRALEWDHSGMLYVGGNFDEAGGVTANRIATWNGINWGTLGSGTSGFVEAIVSTPTDVYIGGNFAIAGGITVNRIAKWNKPGNTWSKIGNGVNNLVNTLLHDGTHLYAAGSFDLAHVDTDDSIIVNNISRWSHTTGWKALGTLTNVGVDTKINDMAFAQDSEGTNKIFIGGNFSRSGAILANNASQWLSDNLLDLPDNATNTLYLYPNPTTGIIHLTQEVEWVLTDILGKILETAKSDALNISFYSTGLYFFRMKNGPTFKILKK